MFSMGQRNKIIFLHAIPCWDVQATNQKILLQDSTKAPRVKYSGRPRAPQRYEPDFHGKSCRVLPGKGNCSPIMKARAKCHDFLTLWKDADSDIPIFIVAESEFGKLK